MGRNDKLSRAHAATRRSPRGATVTLRQCVVTMAMTAALVGARSRSPRRAARNSRRGLAGCRRPAPPIAPTSPARASATGTLAGRKLTITGSFEGLAAPATVARLHQGIAKGARGTAITDLTVTQGRERHALRLGRSDARAGREPPAGQALYPAAQREGCRSGRQQSLGLVPASESIVRACDDAGCDQALCLSPRRGRSPSASCSSGPAAAAAGPFTAEQATAGRAAFQTRTAPAVTARI